MLRDLPLKRRYRTGRDNLVHDFYVPLLSTAREYKRAVGYFSSGSLALAGQGLNHLIEHGGRIQLIASPILDESDITALERGVLARDDIVERALLRSLVQVDGFQKRRLEFISWMLAEGVLDIKIASMGEFGRGLFHEKIGWISDGQDAVAFSGSANETAAALLNNFESLSVYRSWHEAEADWVNEIRQDFDAMWSNETPELQIQDLPDAIRSGILELAPVSWHHPPPDPEDSSESDLRTGTSGRLVSPNWLEIRPYQRQAISAWFGANGQGILEMATGTGKTLTALSLAAFLQKGVAEEHDQPLFVLIVCPFVNLVRQWEKEVRSFGVVPLLGLDNAANWRLDLEALLDSIGRGSIKSGVFITTNATLAGKSFQGLKSKLPRSTLVIADEVHNLGTLRLAQALPEQCQYRLGLSATPERWLDSEGTSRIREYFGETVFSLSLPEAINMGVLCAYEYHPVLVTLDEDEYEEYINVSEAIARLASQGDQEVVDDHVDGMLRNLLFRRARLIGGARQKVPATLEILSGLQRKEFTVVYCGDSSEYGSGSDHSGLTRQIDQVVAGASLPPLNMSVARYTSRESTSDRRRLEEQFAKGELQALVAIRCLDEGVDIPSMQTAIILASTTNPRQFIQRRGRVLRQAEGKDLATIYDLVVVPGTPDALPARVFNLERRLFRKELIRIVEFAQTARNGTEVLNRLRPLRQMWNCLDV